MRGDLTDEEWAIIGGLLPPERGRWLRPAQDNRNRPLKAAVDHAACL
ncbi:hypothetical protein [Komagataeibacter saccharivorans]